MSVEKVIEDHTDQLMTIPGVEGVGVGGTVDAPEIVVMVRSAATAKARQIPKTIQGYRVRVENVGEVRAY